MSAHPTLGKISRIHPNSQSAPKRLTRNRTCRHECRMQSSLTPTEKKQLITSLNWPYGHTDHAPELYHTPAAHVPAIHPSVRKRSRAVYAYAALAALCGWLFGIVPYCGSKSATVHNKSAGKGFNIPRSVVLNVVLLDLLDVVIRLRKVHSLGILPCKISNET